MLKRLFWLSAGVLVGWASAWWAMLRVQRTIRRVPDQVREDAVVVAKRVGADVRAAVDDGRVEMHQTEARLRARLIGEPSMPGRARPADR